MKDFNLIYKKYSNSVLYYITIKISNKDIAQELCNDVFMKIHAHLHRFDENKSSISTWIINITKNTVVDYYRKKKILMISLGNDDNILDDYYISPICYLKVTEPNPIQQITNKETMANIQKEMVSLPKKYKRICNLYFNHNMRYKEIAKLIGMSLSNVKAIIFRGRKILIKNIDYLSIYK